MSLKKSYKLLILISLALPMSKLFALEEVVDLQQVAQKAKSQGLPIMVMFGATHCEYCERLEADHLGPMDLSQEYKNRVIIRKLNIDRGDYMKDFEGKRIAYEDFANRYDVDLTPTTILLDHSGRILTKKLLGYNGSDFFAVTLDRAIKTASKKIN